MESGVAGFRDRPDQVAGLIAHALHVRPASLDDVDEVLDLLAEAAAWMEARGYANWPDRFSRRFIEASVNDDALHVVEIDAAMVATITLQWSDPRFWGETDADAGYVHRLAVRRPQSGHGIGYRLLDRADGQLRARGRDALRLDVVSDNAPLRRYYEQVGFVHQRDLEGEAVLRDGTRWSWRTSLYERHCR